MCNRYDWNEIKNNEDWDEIKLLFLKIYASVKIVIINYNFKILMCNIKLF